MHYDSSVREYQSKKLYRIKCTVLKNAFIPVFIGLSIDCDCSNFKVLFLKYLWYTRKVLYVFSGLVLFEWWNIIGITLNSINMCIGNLICDWLCKKGSNS